MKVQTLIDAIGADFYTGVPDSQLKALCNYLMHTYGIDEKHHLIAANEGNAAALAAGYYMATGRVPVVYMQNSGEGNIINPAASLLNDQVYAIPVVFVIGWRGEPGVHDEPQHIYQGEVTVKLLDDMGIASFIIGKDTTEEELRETMKRFRPLLDAGKDVAFVVRKGALTDGGEVEYKNEYTLVREDAIKQIIRATGENPVICTTGKPSRELFEAREAFKQGHQYDFLTVGSMGHASSIALAIAVQKPEKKVWCIDGDGALLMHMGSLAVTASVHPRNMVHIIINNGAHETVGGMPTAVEGVDIPALARACGYPCAMSASTPEELEEALKKAVESDCLCLLEVKCALGARDDLGRPTTTALENRKNFMSYLLDEDSCK